MPASSKSVDERLRRLAEVKQMPPDAARELVHKGILDKIGFVAAKAADLAAELKFRQLLPDLVSAFAFHLINPARTDKGCAAKIAIARALHELDYDNSELFEKAISYVQFEDSWGDPIDTAIPLRAISAIALAAQRNPRVLELLIPAMTDTAASVRAAAMRAIAATGREEGQLLLRLKAVIGDTDEEVLTDCFTALLDLAGDKSLDFVAGFLDGRNPTNRTAAALALGTCKSPQAFDLLHRQFSNANDPDFRQALLLSMASMRDPRAMDFLLSIIREGTASQASEAIRVLKASRLDDRTRSLIRTAIEARGDKLLLKVLDEPR